MHETMRPPLPKRNPRAAASVARNPGIRGEPHGEFDYINKTVEKYRPDAIVILGDLQPPDDLETLLAPTLAITQVWWIPGNHDTDCEEYYDRLWHGPIAEHNLHGRVAEVAGLRIAGLGGVFRGQIWMPEGRPNYQSATGFVRRSPKTNLWRGGLPRRHRSSIFPATYEALQQCKADILVTHEAAGCHKKGFDAIDRLAKSLGVKWLFHGHQHEDCEYGVYKGMQVRAVGFRGIVDLNGRVVRPAEIDPRDILVMQQAGEEPSPDELDSIPFDFQEMLGTSTETVAVDSLKSIERKLSMKRRPSPRISPNKNGRRIGHSLNDYKFASRRYWMGTIEPFSY